MIRLILMPMIMLLSLAAFPSNKIDLQLRSKVKSQPFEAEYSESRKHFVGRFPTFEALDSVDADHVIPVMIALDDERSAEILRSIGADVTLSVGRYAVCGLTRDILDDIEALDEVRSIAPLRSKRLLTDIARDLTGVDMLHSGIGVTSLSGRDVIVGIVDGGVDPNHINFIDGDGCSRVKRIWHYEYQPERGVCRQTEYADADAIASFTTDDKSATHGTHVLGIAAGSCRIDRFYGMAPEAEIVIACGDMTDDAILSGISNIVEYAKSVGRPCVINLSLGCSLGHHDGTDPFTASLNEFAAETPVVIAAGNEAMLDIALKKRLTHDDRIIRTFLMPNSRLAAVDSRYQASGTVEIIGEDSTPFMVKVALFDVETGELDSALEAGDGHYNYIAGSRSGIEDYVFSEAFDIFYTDDCYFGAVKGVCPDNGRYYAYVDFDLFNYYRRPGVYPAIIVEGEAGKCYELYADGNYTRFSSRGLAGWDDAAPDGSINDMACGSNTIAVGAYAVRNSFPYDGQSIGDIADYSSFATFADGRSLPDVCAPGNALVSSFSRYFVEQSSQYKAASYPIFSKIMTSDGANYWSHMGGTSMAAPVVAGVVALWLESDPDLTPEQIRNLAKETAFSDEFTSSIEGNPARWGAGKINAFGGVQSLRGNTTSVVATLAEQQDIHILSEDSDRCRVMQSIDGPMYVKLMHSSGCVVLSVMTSSVDYEVDMTNLPEGVYILSAENRGCVVHRKLMVR